MAEMGLLTILFSAAAGLAVLVVCGIIGGAIGRTREDPIPGFLLGLLLGPFGWLIILFSDNRPQCPECLGHIPTGARRCMHCREELPIPAASTGLSLSFRIPRSVWVVLIVGLVALISILVAPRLARFGRERVAVAQASEQLRLAKEWLVEYYADGPVFIQEYGPVSIQEWGRHALKINPTETPKTYTEATALCPPREWLLKTPVKVYVDKQGGPASCTVAAKAAD